MYSRLSTCFHPILSWVASSPAYFPASASFPEESATCHEVVSGYRCVRELELALVKTGFCESVAMDRPSSTPS